MLTGFKQHSKPGIATQPLLQACSLANIALTGFSWLKTGAAAKAAVAQEAAKAEARREAAGRLRPFSLKPNTQAMTPPPTWGSRQCR